MELLPQQDTNSEDGGYSMDLEIENGNNVILSGKSVIGRLCFALERELNAGAYSLNIFVEGIFVSVDEYTKQEITFLKCRADGLTDDEDAFNDETLMAGEHIFDFAVNLPQHLPSSLTILSWISVKYNVKAQVINEFKKIIASTFYPITIYDLRDLNEDPDNLLPLVRKIGETNIGILDGVLACIRGRTSTVCSIPQRGYLPSSMISLTVNMAVPRSNSCMSCVTPTRSTEVFLVQKIRWKETFYKSYLVTGTKVEGEDLLDPELIRSGYTLEVPTVPPTGNYPELELCINYIICVKIHVGIHRPPIRVHLPINIGTVPLLENIGIDVPY